MDIGAIDRSATSDAGWLHLRSPRSKLAAFALVIAAVVVTWNAFVALAVVLAVFGAAASSRVDLKLTLALAAYPAAFAFIFGIAASSDPLYIAVLMLKAVAAGLSAVTIVLTTPYPQIFAPVQRIVPGIVGDALLMTYRTTFLLLDKFANLVRAVRLRAGVRGTHSVRTARATTQALGGLLLYSLDLAQRDYDVMRLRGYSGRLRTEPVTSADARVDVAVVLAAALVLAASVAVRVGASALNPYSWLLPVAALLLLAPAAAVRRRKS